MKFTVKLSFLIISGVAALFTFAPSFSAAWTYPVSKVSLPACRGMHWAQQTTECKIALPRISQGNYLDHIKNPVYRSVYSVLWGATYVGSWDQGKGSHLGVDIVSAKGTPILAIGDGEVVAAGLDGGRGNVISIKHQSEHGTIFSTYAHMERLQVSKGDRVIEGQQIGTMGDTGNSSGPHLHLQIERDTQKSHPYYYGTCQAGHGMDVFSVVDLGLCRDDVLQHTIDPIRFLESQGAMLYAIRIGGQEFADLWEAAEALTKEDIIEYERDNFLSFHNLVFSTDAPDYIMSLGSSFNLFIQTRSFFSTQESVKLPEPLGIEIEDPSLVEVFPGEILYINDERRIMLMPLRKGSTQIRVKMGDEVLREQDFHIQDEVEVSHIDDYKLVSIKKKNKPGLVIVKLYDANGDLLQKGDSRNGSVSLCSQGDNSLFLPRSISEFVNVWKRGRVSIWDISDDDCIKVTSNDTIVGKILVYASDVSRDFTLKVIH